MGALWLIQLLKDFAKHSSALVRKADAELAWTQIEF
jgi:hypothetical protein